MKRTFSACQRVKWTGKWVLMRWMKSLFSALRFLFFPYSIISLLLWITMSMIMENEINAQKKTWLGGTSSRHTSHVCALLSLSQLNETFQLCFKGLVSLTLLIKFVAIRLPIWPSPMKPTVVALVDIIRANCGVIFKSWNAMAKLYVSLRSRISN